MIRTLLLAGLLAGCAPALPMPPFNAPGSIPPVPTPSAPRRDPAPAKSIPPARDTPHFAPIPDPANPYPAPDPTLPHDARAT